MKINNLHITIVNNIELENYKISINRNKIKMFSLKISKNSTS